MKDEYAGDITKGGRCDGSEEKPYEINCIEDLVVLSIMTNGGNTELNLTSSTFYEKTIVLKRTLNFNSKYSMDEILVENSSYENIYSLKKRLIANNLLEYVCARCGNNGEWNGEELVLQLEHKNGIHNDHRLCNLEFLCPNCHSQTNTYSGRNKGKYDNQKEAI